MNEPRHMSTIHYRILGGLGLAMICIAQDFQDIIISNVFMAAMGLWMILYPRPRIPALFVVLLATSQMLGHYQTYQSFRVTPRFVPFESITLLLAGGTLIFIASQYRLIAIRWHAAPYDPRFPSPKLHDESGRVLATMARPEKSLRADEVVRLAFCVAVAMAAGEGAWNWLSEDWNVLGFTPRFLRIALLIWIVFVGMFVGTGLVGYWQAQHDDPARARLYLQEVAWQAARREYARIGRWIAWGKKREAAQRSRKER